MNRFKALTLLFLFPAFLYAQTYKCNLRMNEIGMWENSITTLEFKDNTIVVKEYDGIQTNVQFDNKQYTEGLWIYSYQGVIRATLCSKGELLINVIGKNYMCTNNN